MERSLPKFEAGDIVLFLGSLKSVYGTNHNSDEYIGKYVTIGERHRSGYPYAYTFKEFSNHYWFSENCFEPVEMPELPEFEASGSIDAILF